MNHAIIYLNSDKAKLAPLLSIDIFVCVHESSDCLSSTQNNMPCAFY